MARNDNAYLYTHTRPDTGQVFYVGIGCSANYKRAFQHDKRSERWRRIVKKAGLEVKVVIDNITWRQAESWERYLIGLHGREQLSQGPLCNMTDGGDGTVGWVMSLEQRKAISERMKGKPKHYQIIGKRRPVLQYTKEGEFIREWESVTAVTKAGVSKNIAHIAATCRGVVKSAGGFVWKYKENVNKQ